MSTEQVPDQGPAGAPEPSPARQSDGIRWNPWNLLLLIPLLMLITPWFNHDGPRLIGIPFFYWFQFMFVPVGVICVWVVHLMTRGEPVGTDQPDLLSVDQLDEGEQR